MSENKCTKCSIGLIYYDDRVTRLCKNCKPDCEICEKKLSSCMEVESGICHSCYYIYFSRQMGHLIMFIIVLKELIV